MSRVVSSAFGMLLGVVIACLFFSSPTHAEASSSVVINAIQTGDAQSANDEIIEVYNNSDDTVEVTNWCLYYASASTTSNGTKIACFTSPDSLTHFFLDSHAYATFASKQYVAAQPSVTPDYPFSATLSGSGGHVRLLDADESVIDKVGWGTAVSPEGTTSTSPPLVGFGLSRNLIDEVFVDSDDNAADFTAVVLLPDFSNHQLYILEDACANIDGLQQVVPDDMVADDQANCIVPVDDQCPNILGTQAEVPPGYELRDDRFCWQIVPLLTITEVLPNPSGSDASNEFIELSNASDQDVILTNDVLKIGQSLETTIKFVHGEIVPANGYLVMQSSDYSFSLLNTSDLVALTTVDGQTIDQILPYSDPDDGLAWALIDNVWQYTDQPTPGAPNLLSLDSVDSDTADTNVALALCAANQYRNPATGRCKLLAGQSSTLVPCKDDQYRSEETGRCRTIAPATTTPTACPVGQERNVDTGRCRKIVLSTPPKANYAVLGASTSSSHNYVLWAVVGILVLGIGYAVWEWHEEIVKVFLKARRFVRFSK